MAMFLLLSINYFYSESMQTQPLRWMLFLPGVSFVPGINMYVLFTILQTSRHFAFGDHFLYSCDLHFWLSRDILWRNRGLSIPFAVRFTMLFNIYSKFLINVQHFCEVIILSCVTQKKRENCWSNGRAFFTVFIKKTFNTHSLKS